MGAEQIYLKCKVQAQHVSITALPDYLEGLESYGALKVELGDDWKTLTPINVTFVRDTLVIKMALDANGECILPKELFIKYGEFYFYLVGGNSKPTNSVVVKVGKGADNYQPTPNPYNYIQTVPTQIKSIRENPSTKNLEYSLNGTTFKALTAYMPIVVNEQAAGWAANDRFISAVPGITTIEQLTNTPIWIRSAFNSPTDGTMRITLGNLVTNRPIKIGGDTEVSTTIPGGKIKVGTIYCLVYSNIDNLGNSYFTLV